MDGLVADRPAADDRFAQGYKFFKAQIAKWLAGEDSNPDLRAERGEMLARVERQHLWLIALNLAEDDQAQVIFETLNARGTALTPGDLVKNVLLRRAQEEGSPVALLYEKHWRHFDNETIWQQKVGAGYTARPRLDFFLQQALTVLTQKSIAMGQVYDQFVSYITSTKGKISAAEHLIELSRLSTTARRVYLAEDTDSRRAMVAVARIKSMDFTTAMPVFLTLLADNSRDPGDVDVCARWIESFLVRRTVCGLNTGMYGLFFVDVMKKAMNATKSSEAVAEFLLGQTSDSQRWPEDDEFEKAWLEKPLYKTLKRGRLTMILRALEESFRDAKFTDPVPIPRTLHVEHIMPQSWGQWWPLPNGADLDAGKTRDRVVQTIGNLTLIKERLNEKLSNNPWATVDGKDCKRTALRQHGLMRLNSDLGTYEIWNEDTIRERGKLMLDHAIRIWSRPTLRSI